MAHSHRSHDVTARASRSKWILIGFLAIAGFFLFTEHRAHLYGALPFLLILACPLMHLFHGHGSHGGSHGGTGGNGRNAGDTPPSNRAVPTHDHGRKPS